MNVFAHSEGRRSHARAATVTEDGTVARAGRPGALTTLTALAALVVTACGGGGRGGAGNPPVTLTPPPPVNAAPTVAPVAAQRTDQDTPLTVTVTVSDAETAAGDLVLTADSSNKALVPADGTVLSGSGAARTLRLTPLEDAVGSSTITLTVRDGGGATSTASFALSVQAVNASLVNTTGTAFTRGSADGALSVNGRTYVQDADDGSFTNLLGSSDSLAGN
jgi:hypothetical protein